MKKKNLIKLIIFIGCVLLCIALLVFLSIFIVKLFTNTIQQKKTMCLMTSDQTPNGYVLSTEYEITSQGDIVDKIHIKETITSSNEEILNKYKQQWEEQYKYNHERFGSYDYKVEIDKNKVVSNVDIDYKVFNLHKFIRYNAAMKEYTKDDKLPLEGAKRLYESSGAVCQ